MNTNQLTHTLTDTVPSVIADTLSDVGSAIEVGAGAVGGAVSEGVSSGRRYAGSITTPSWMPGPTAHSNRRWWFAAGALALLAVVGAVWYTRRPTDDRSTGDGVADLDQRRSVA
jgi:hypothetical protein